MLTGAGQAVCVGRDIAGMAQRMQAPPGEVAFNGWEPQQRVHLAPTLLYGLSKRVIAAVNGPTSRLRADLAVARDFVIARTRASFARSCIHRGLVFPSGGQWAELFNDICLRPLPLQGGLDEEEARADLHEPKIWSLLDGYRGRAAVDIAATAGAIVEFSRLAVQLRDRLFETEIKPLIYCLMQSKATASRSCSTPRGDRSVDHRCCIS